LIANTLTLLAFGIHAFVGDKELKLNEPEDKKDDNSQIGQWILLFVTMK
jgi:hypothetical protein